ncbi:hypothetical protein SY83_13135 [Paenibacillus swuensis]|uniref:Glycosyltransferase RgtA/B/C/D-like domain-containing protein n=1 Tax=Paenibacillus swuensis TaxID=1178515 RepID=A0A172TJT9_9BACL|nr:hypothetical protein [Paenibacillus swuensis]ANE47053.1 hypothetical protein SY83_13135 [Paenibacillus swuensis]
MFYFLIVLIFYVSLSSAYGLVTRIKFVDKYIDNQQGSVILLPFLGMSILISILQTAGIFVGTKYITPLIVTGGLILAINMTNKVRIKSYLNNNVNYYVVTILTLVVLIYSMPSIIAGFPTSFSSINNDLIFYLSIPEWLQDHTYFAKPISDQLHPFYSIAELHFSRFSRVGADYINTLGMDFFNIGAIHTFNIMSCLYVIFVALATYYVSKYCFKLSNSITYTWMFLSSINSLVYWMFTTQYMPQLGGNAYYLLSIGLLYRLFHEKNNKLLLQSALSIVGLISIYSEYTAYLALPVFIYIVYLAIIEKHKLLDLLKRLSLLIVCCILLNPVAVYLCVRYNLFAYTTTQNNTGIVEYIPFSNQILMLLGIKTLDYNKPTLLIILISIIIIAVMLFGLIKLKKEVFRYILLYLSFIVLMLFYLTFINHFPYGYYKTLMFAIPIAMLLFSVGTNELLKNERKRYLPLLLAVLLIFNIPQMYKLQNGILNNGHLITNTYLELNEMEKLIPINETLYIEGYTMNEQHMIAYFLKERSLFFVNSNSYFTPLNKQENAPVKYTLKQSATDITPQNGETIWSNQKFNLIRNSNNDFKLNLGVGWHQIERWANVPTRWTEEKFTLNLSSRKNISNSIEFNAYLPPEVKERTLDIFVSDKKISEIKITNDKQTYSIPILNSNSSSGFEIQIKVREGAVQVGSDPRMLGIAIQNIKMTE